MVQTDRPTDTQSDRQTDRHTERSTNRLSRGNLVIIDVARKRQTDKRGDKRERRNRLRQTGKLSGSEANLFQLVAANSDACTVIQNEETTGHGIFTVQ